MKRIATILRNHLAQGPRRHVELGDALKAAGYAPRAWLGAGLWLDMLRATPLGTWERRRADLYVLAEDWIEMPSIPEEEGLKHIVRRYLGGFGPAPVKDIANWAGLPVLKIRPVIERMKLRNLRDEQGGILVDLNRAPLPPADTPVPVRFLPHWDATLLAHARRTQILPAQYRNLVFNSKTPQSTATFLVDGSVAGTWRYEGGRVVLEPFHHLPRAARRDAEDEADGLARFHE